jgi:small subunit ribosomal protein S24e
MEVKITQQKDNALMGRKDVRFTVNHAGETTPNRAQVRQLVASEMGTKTENVVIERMQSEYGLGRSSGTARAYTSADMARKQERTHLLKRNQLYIEKPKKGGAAADGAKAEGGKPEAKKEEAKPAAAPAKPAALAAKKGA